MKGRIAWFFLFGIAASLLWCDDTSPEKANAEPNPIATNSEIDDLFFQSEDRTVSEENLSPLAEFEKPEPLKIYGSITATAGVSAGWTDWPEPGDLTKNWSLKPGVLFSSSLIFDARPDPDFRIHGSAIVDYASKFTISVSEIFFDYVVLDSIFFRGGKQTIGWGTGNFFAAGNFASGSADALSLKAYLPFSSIGLTFVGMLKAIDDISLLSIKDLSVAGRMELSFFGTEWSGSLLSSYSQPISLNSVLKGTFLGADVFGTVSGAFGSSIFSFSSATMGVFWDYGDPKIILNGEYFIGKDGAGNADQRVAFGVALKIPTPLNPKIGLQISHAFSDNSGSVLPAFSFSPFPHVTVSAVVPIAYGDVSSIYVKNPPPGWDEKTPWSHRCAFALKIDLASGF